MQFNFVPEKMNNKLASMTALIILLISWTSQAWGNPEAPLHFNKAAAFSKAEKWQEALYEYKKALAMQPGNAVAIANLGVAYSRLLILAFRPLDPRRIHQCLANFRPPNPSLMQLMHHWPAQIRTRIS